MQVKQMKNMFSLNGDDWKLVGWNRHQWKYERAMEPAVFQYPLLMEILQQYQVRYKQICLKQVLLRIGITEPISEK